METILLLFQFGLEQKIVDLEQEVSRLKQELQQRKEQVVTAELAQQTAHLGQEVKELRQDTEGCRVKEQQSSREPSSSPIVLSSLVENLKVSITNWLKGSVCGLD
jgi:cell division septum initiation protein DivIVA